MSDDDHDFEQQVARRQPGGDVGELLRRAREIVDAARQAPLSSSVKVDRDELLDVLDKAIELLPEEVRAARWLVKEREEHLNRTHREAGDILAAARGQAERMVQRSEVIKAAEAKARRIIEQAETEAGRLRNEADDFCDQRLAQFEAVLEKTMGVVAAGRAKLRGPVVDAAAAGNGDAGSADDEATGSAGSAFFDQDRA